VIAYHHSTESSAQERGHAFGRAHADRVENTLSAYTRLFAELHGIGEGQIGALGEVVGRRLGEDAPELREEIEGIAAGAGVDELALFAANARTEILAGAARPECSAIGLLPEITSDGSTILAQNWDWHPDLTESRVVWRVENPDGSWFVTLTEAGLLAKIGLNSRGLGVCLNILTTTREGGVGGLPIHVLLRLLLQGCENLSSALRLLLNADVTASSCFNVGFADGGGALVSVEVSPGGTAVIWPKRGLLLHTNHFLRQPPGADDRMRREWPDTLVRYNELERRVASAPPSSVSAVADLLRSHFNGPIAICCHDAENSRYGDRQATLASVVLDLTNRRLLITDGAPCSASYDDLTTGPALQELHA
jgi:isopenicillin-N N-acyltransferase-like protein